MRELSWAETVRRVHQRADNRCEYCQTAQRVMGQAMHVEHIHPDGPDALENLCLSCPSCNLSKGKAMAAPDPETAETVPLFTREPSAGQSISSGYKTGKSCAV